METGEDSGKQLLLREKESERRGCRLNHQHLRHFTTPFSLRSARGSECGSGRPATFPLPLRRPPPADPLLQMNPFIIFSFRHFHVSLPRLYSAYYYFIFCFFLPCSFFKLSHTPQSHSFCHGRGKENDRPGSRERQRRTSERGEPCPDGERNERLFAGRSPPSDGLSRAENSERGG